MKLLISFCDGDNKSPWIQFVLSIPDHSNNNQAFRLPSRVYPFGNLRSYGSHSLSILCCSSVPDDRAFLVLYRYCSSITVQGLVTSSLTPRSGVLNMRCFVGTTWTNPFNSIPNHCCNNPYTFCSKVVANPKSPSHHLHPPTLPSSHLARASFLDSNFAPSVRIRFTQSATSLSPATES